MRVSRHTDRKPRVLRDPLSQLMDRVTKTDSCWLWTGALQNKGYGSVRRETYGACLAHRAVYIHSGFELKPEDCLLHTCDRPACVNPEHMFVGTKKDNTQDMIKKGRWKGKPSLPGRIDKDEVLILLQQGYSKREVAKKVGTVASWVSRIHIRALKT
jgi:hypothetical protein